MVDLTLVCLTLFFSEGLSFLPLFTLTLPDETEAVMWLEKATGEYNQNCIALSEYSSHVYSRLIALRLDGTTPATESETCTRKKLFFCL